MFLNSVWLFQGRRRKTVVATAASLLSLLALPGAQAQTVDEQYRLGLYQRETGAPYSAIETLESLLAANPTINRARLELAVAYYRTLNFAKARDEAQRVLADPKTPEPVRLSVMSFLKQLELDEAATFGKPHAFEPSVSVGLLYDSNVNAGPDSAVLPGGLVLTPGSTSQSDWGTTLQAGLTHTWVRPAPVRLGEATARFGWTSSASAYYKAYQEHNEYDLGVLTLSTGPTLIIGQDWRGNLNFQADQLTLDGRNLGQYIGLAPSMAWRLGTAGEVSVDAQWVRRNFKREVDAGRDSYHRSLGVSYGHMLGQGKVALQGGTRVFSEDAEDTRFSNTGYEVFFGGRMRAWEGGDVFARASWRRTRFKGVEPIYDAARRETEQRVELGASHDVRTGWLEKWQLSATYTHVNNDANLSLYGYDRDMVLAALGRSF